jgi:hypothetical protein
MGKSSTLKLVERALEKAADHYLILKFDAWLYQDFDDARAALMSVISTSLVTAVPPTFKEKAKVLMGRVNKLQLLGHALESAGVPRNQESEPPHQRTNIFYHDSVNFYRPL